MEDSKTVGTCETTNPGTEKETGKEIGQKNDGNRETVPFFERVRMLQDKISVPKSRYNKYGDFYYRSCPDIETAMKPLLRELDLWFNYNSEVEVTGDRYYLITTATLCDIKDMKNPFVQVSYTSHIWMDAVKPKMDSAQTSGSYESYAKKRALEGLLLLDDAQDPDDPKKPSETKSVQAGGISEEQGKAYLAKCKEVGGQPGYWLKRFNIKRLSEMTVGQWKTAMGAMERVKKQFNSNQ